MPINTNSMSSLPNMSDVIESWQSDYTCYIIKKTITDFEIVETREKITFKGIIQNDSGKQLNIKDIGERNFNTLKLHTLKEFNNDDIIEVFNKRYRILKSNMDTTYYGFYHYNLVEDYEDN